MTKMRPVTARMTKGFCFFTRISERQLVFAQDHIPAMLSCQAWITAVRASTQWSGFVEDALVIGFVGGILFAEKENVFLETALADEVFGGAAVGAVADEDELGGHFGPDNCENFDGIGEALDGTEIREVHEDGFAVGSPLGGESFVGGAAVEIAVYEIGDDFDGALDVEFLERLVEQIAGDGGDAVALLDGAFSGGKIAAIAAEESNVRTGQGGYGREATRRGHGAREHGADGMRNSVVNVEQVE